MRGCCADVPLRGLKRELCATKRAMQLIEPDEFCSILEPVGILPPEKPTNIGYPRKKRRLRSCRPAIPVVQAAEASTGDDRCGCRRSTFIARRFGVSLSSES